MKRLINSFENANNTGRYNAESGVLNNDVYSPYSATNTNKEVCVYASIYHAENTKVVDSEKQLNDSVSLSNINNTGSAAMDIYYLDGNGYLHEVNNSEFLFDSLFDYIIRGNNRISALGISHEESVTTDNAIIHEDI